MAATDIDALILRDTTQAPFTNKNDTLTYAELDSNFVTIGLYLDEMEAAIDVTAYSGATVYDQNDTVLYSGKFWVYLPAMSGTAVAPGTNPAVWELTTIGALLHKKNQDSQLVGTSGTITANEIIAYTGLLFDLELDGTTGNGEVGYVTLVTPPVGTVIESLKTLAIDSNLTPDDSELSLVLSNGTTDVVLAEAATAADLNEQKLIVNNLDPVAVASGYSLRIKVETQNVSGDLKIKANYF